MEIIQPYIDTILQALMGLLVSLLIAALVSLRQKVNKWLESKTTDAQRDMLHKLAVEAFAYAETIVTNADGKFKLESAIIYLTNRLSEKGIQVNASEIRATIEKAVLFYNKKDDVK